MFSPGMQNWICSKHFYNTISNRNYEKLDHVRLATFLGKKEKQGLQIFYIQKGFFKTIEELTCKLLVFSLTFCSSLPGEPRPETGNLLNQSSPTQVFAILVL